MSRRGKKTSKAISVYLSPRAKEVLDKYYKNSGFGSVSRTVEELILSYDKIYTTLLSGIASTGIKEFFSNPASLLVTFSIMVSNLDLSDGSPYEQVVREQVNAYLLGKVE